MPRTLQRVCVYCASSLGNDPRFAEAATTLGQALADAGIGLVYGGGRVGLMGTIADTVMAAGGEVIVVIPQGLFSKEVAHTGLTELVEVDSMHTRKAKMCELADGFVALPGGLGTFEELFEIATWNQLGIHDKPVVALDFDGYYAPLFDLLDRAVGAGLLKDDNRGIIARVTEVDAVISTLQTHTWAAAEKWLDLDES